MIAYDLSRSDQAVPRRRALVLSEAARAWRGDVPISKTAIVGERLMALEALNSDVTMPVHYGTTPKGLAIILDALMFRQSQLFREAFEVVGDGTFVVLNESAHKRYQDVSTELDRLRAKQEGLLLEAKLKQA
jgi:hypothetical protein